MNKIFKVIYSKTKHCYVVVSELAKSHCKSTVCPGKSKTALTAAVLLALGTFSVASLLMPMTVEAATKTRTDGSNYVGVERTDGLTEENDFKNYGGKGANGADSITLGLNAQAGAGTITIGDRNSGASLGSVYIGQGDVASPKVDRGGWATSVGYNSDATGYGSIALGSNAVAKNSYDKDSKGNSLVYNQTYVENGETKVRLVSKPDIQRASVAIGYGASADNGNIAIGSYSDASTDLRADTSDAAKSYLTTKTADSYVSVGKSDALRRISNVADGAADTDVATIAQVKKAVEATDASKKANIDASNIGSKLQYKADGTTAAEDSDKKANENLWGAAIGTGSVADSTATDAADNGSQQLVTGGTVYSALQKQKTELTDALSVNAGWGINIKDETTQNADGTETTTKNVISLNRNLGTNLDTTGHVYLDVSETGLVLGTLVNGADGTDTDLHYGATGDYAVTVGGGVNTASGFASTVLGGSGNTASSEAAVVSGGAFNVASGSMSAVYGGSYNEASGGDSAIFAGMQNKATKNWATVGGGAVNEANGTYSSIWGGYMNKATDNFASIYGGMGNSAYGPYSAILGGGENKAGQAAVVSGGLSNEAVGAASAVVGGKSNIVTGANATALGGVKGSVNGTASVGILGGSTGKDAIFTLAAGYQSTVTNTGVKSTPISEEEAEEITFGKGLDSGILVDNGDIDNPSYKIVDNFATAIGYKATADEAQTVAFGHDKGDTYFGNTTYTWKQKATVKDGHYYDEYGNEISEDYYKSLMNADGTWNDYSQPIATVEEKKYDSAYYNRLVKVADGIDDHDVVVMEQLKQYAEKDAGNIGNNLTVAPVYQKDDKGNIKLGTDSKPLVDEEATQKKLAEAQTANKDAWGKALGAGTFTTGTSDKATDASTSDQLVTGKTLYNYDKPTGTLNYVSANSTTGQNLTALDTQVKANADTLNDSTHNIKYYSVNSTNAPTFGLNDYTNEKNDGASGRASLAAGFITHADGLASTVAGSYSGIYNQGTVSGTDFRGAAALSLGTVNINRNTDTTKPYSGVANSLIGQANVTMDSNAAIILGAGNTVKDSYRTISNLNLSGDMTAALKEAVPRSGGQVMVMGGGNSVEKAYMTQVTGVGNTVTGSGTEYGADSTQLNYIEGFYTKLENGKNDYLIGAHNTVTGDSTDKNQSNIVFGDNHKLTNQKNNVILGSLDKVDETTVSDAVSIGHNAKVTKEGGVAIGSGSEATTAAGVAGYDPTGATADTTAAWTSKKAAVSVGTADETRQITGVAAGKEETDAVNVAQLKKLNGMKANVNADNIGKNLNHKADGTAVTEEDKTANENAWGAAIGTGSIAADNGQLVTGKTVYEYNKPVAAEGKTLNYISDTNTTGQNLGNLDAQVGTNTGDISKLKNLSNISSAGETVIKNLSKDAVKVAQGERVTVDTSTDATGATVYTVSANNNGQVTDGDQNLVSGDTVNTAITKAITKAGTATDTKLAGKANVDASNIGTKLNAGATDEEKAAQQTNLDNWGTAIGTGTIASTSNQLVTGKTVYAYNKPVAAEGKTLNYVSDTKTTGQNLGSLDAQVGTNTGDISKLKNLSNISSAGETVIKNLSKDAVKVAQGERVTVDTSTDATGATVYTVSANNNGQVTDGDQNLVSGDTVNTAITKAITKAGTATDTKLAGKANVDASNIGTKLNAGATDEEKAAQQTNLDNWGTAIGTGTIASTSNQLVTGKTVYAYNKPVAAEGKTLNYVSDTKTTGQNLGSLDAQVGTNTGDISNLKNLSNISSAGETVIKNLAKGSIGMENGNHTTVSHEDKNGVETYKVDVTVDGQVTENNKGIVDGGTVYKAIQDVKTKTSADLENKANVDASNLTADNVTKWQEKLGNGQVVSGNTGLVTGDTVFQAVDTKANRDGSNLTADEANKFSEKIAVGKVEANDKRAVSGETVSKAISDLTGDMNTKLDGKANTSLDNITEDGQNVIRDLAKGSVKVIDGTNTTVTAVEGKGEKPTTYAVNVEGKGTVTSGNTGLISGGTAYTELRPADGTYVKQASTTAANLTALDKGLKTTSDLIHTNDKGDTIQIGGNSTATKIDVSGKDANGNTTGRVITGVISDASDPNSAANVGYVNGVTAANTQQIYRDMNNAYSRLDNNINKAAAGSNALAALHPLDYDPADKANFAVGYGHYHNANAAAIGAFYYPNADTMVNVGVSVGNGDPGFNAGVSFRIGKGSAYNGVSKAEMAQTIHEQAEEIKTIKANDAAKDKRIDTLEKENQEMKKQIQEILARLNG